MLIYIYSKKMILFTIFILSSILCFLASFKFKNHDYVFFMISSLFAILLGVGILSGDIYISESSVDTYTYDGANNIIDITTTSVPYQNPFFNGFALISILIGLYLSIVSIFNLKGGSSHE